MSQQLVDNSFALCLSLIRPHNPFFLSEHRQVCFHIAKLWHHNNVTGHMQWWIQTNINYDDPGPTPTPIANREDRECPLVEHLDILTPNMGCFIYRMFMSKRILPCKKLRSPVNNSPKHFEGVIWNISPRFLTLAWWTEAHRED